MEIYNASLSPSKVELVELTRETSTWRPFFHFQDPFAFSNW